MVTLPLLVMVILVGFLLPVLDFLGPLFLEPSEELRSSVVPLTFDQLASLRFVSSYFDLKLNFKSRKGGFIKK